MAKIKVSVKYQVRYYYNLGYWIGLAVEFAATKQNYTMCSKEIKVPTLSSVKGHKKKKIEFLEK